MKNLTNIAKDYLDAVEVLTEARKQFEEEMGQWWSDLLEETVKPALKEISPGTPYVWENASTPGVCHWRLTKKAPIYLQFKDPRASDRKFYTVSLKMASKPDLQEMKKNAALVDRLEKTAMHHGVGGKDGLNWKSRELVIVDIEILAEDPEETAGQVRDAAISLLQVVLEHHRALGKTG